MSDAIVRPVVLTMDREKRAGDLWIHSYMFVVFDDVRVRVCAESWCTGDCQHPAAVIVIPSTVENIGGREYKLFGDMVAMGRVTQPWRGTWTGAKVVVPSIYWDYLSQRWWQ